MWRAGVIVVTAALLVPFGVASRAITQGSTNHLGKPEATHLEPVAPLDVLTPRGLGAVPKGSLRSASDELAERGARGNAQGALKDGSGGVLATSALCTVYWQIQVSYTHFYVGSATQERNLSEFYDEDNCSDGQVDMTVAAITAHYVEGGIVKSVRKRDGAALPAFPSVSADQTVVEESVPQEVIYTGRFKAEFDSGHVAVNCVRFRGQPRGGTLVQTSGSSSRCN